jgi:hypothetical protein
LKVRAGSFSIDHNLAHYAAIDRGALFLACKATALEFDASFYAVEALNWPPVLSTSLYSVSTYVMGLG